MRLIIIIVLIAIIALVGSQVTFNRRKLPLGTRHFLFTGTEFIFVGFILGPRFLNVLDNQTMIDLHPFLSFALGWIGFLFGLQFDFQRIKYLPRNYFSITLTQSLITLVLVFIAFFYIFSIIMKFDPIIAFVFALTLAAVSACTGQASMAIVHRDFRIPSRGVMNLFRYIAGVDALVSIIMFGLALRYRKSNILLSDSLNHLLAWQWFGLSVIIGIIMGFIFYQLVFSQLNQDELLLIIIGLVTFSAGIALYFQLSPLFINFIMGVVVANRSERNVRALELMIRAEKSIYILMVILAGASWQFGTISAVILAGAFVLIRMIGKLIGGLTAANLFPTGYHVPKHMGLGLLSQGGVAIAIIVNFQQVYQSPYLFLILTIVILATLINELISPVLVLSIVKGK